MSRAGVEYRGVERIEGPLIFVRALRGATLGELVEITAPGGEVTCGLMLEVGHEISVVQVLGGTAGLSSAETRVRLTGEPLLLALSPDMLGRTFDGLGRPRDGLPPVIARSWSDVQGAPINPEMRAYPSDFIQTGLSAIDLMNSLVRGQKLPIFSGSGLPHNRMAAQLVRQAKLRSSVQDFVVIFAAMGVQHNIAQFFAEAFQRSTSQRNVTLFLSLADDPSIERILTPRTALTCAEYLAFELGMHVLVIMSDMTNYCEALREVATARGEIPSRKGYPGYLYSDLASIFERAGRLRDKPGSITQIPILTMPNDDLTHPIPDLSAYITEGQLVLERELFQREIYPPVAVLPSLSRLMKDGIGGERTRADHAHLASQLFSAYAQVRNIRALSSVIGEAEVSNIDKMYLRFGEVFEREVLGQGEEEDRSVEQSLELGWKALKLLPRTELYRFSEDELKRFYDVP